MTDKKTVFITGASNGIGRGLAIAFGKAGYQVIVNYNRNKEAALEIVDMIQQHDSDAMALQGDVSDYEQAKAMVEKALERFGTIDVLINNAGITKDTLMLRMKPQDFEDVIDVNLKGTWHMIKLLTRPMFKQKHGRIINISSVVGSIGNPAQANYAASKAGINGLTKALSKEYGKKQITVNAIAPGFIETDMTKDLSEDIKTTYLAQIPLHRFGDVEDIANTALFLASDDASYITGQIIHVNGGMI